MNNVNNNPANYIDEYNQSSLREVTTATTTKEDYQHQSNVSTIDTATKNAMTTDNDLLTAFPNPNNNNSNPTHENATFSWRIINDL